MERKQKQSMNEKDKIRAEILKQRDQLTEQQLTSASTQIMEKLHNLAEYQNADIFLCYADYRGEVQTKEIITELLQLGKEVYLPKVMGEDMLFFQVKSLSELKEGYKRIMEPDATAERLLDHVKREQKVFMIMPGVAFDRQCNRIGYGKGYYDRYLENVHPDVTAALALSLQIVQNIPANAFDIRPDYVITEKFILQKA